MFTIVGLSGWNVLRDLNVLTYIPVAKVLKRLGLWPTFPVGKGQTFSITGGASGDYIAAYYDLYDAEDVSPGEPNGSDADVYRMIQMISNAGVRATAGDLQLNQSDIDSVFPAFPGGEVVPANTEMALLALFGSGVTKGTAAANGEYTTKLKFLADREDMFDKDLTGLDYLGDVAHVAATTEYETQIGPLALGIATMVPKIITFPDPIIFKAGEEVNIFATLARTGAGADFVAAELKLGLVFDVYRR